jgi:hypothetical protein
MTKQTYRLDVDKIKTLKDARNVFDLMNLVGYYDPEDPEDEHYHLREYFTILQEPQGLTFPPAPRKSIEELQQELDEKFKELLVKTKRGFAISKQSAEYNYNRKFDTIIENFEHAKKWGSFPQTIKLTDAWTKCDFITTNSSFVISNPKKVGYYELVDGVRMESAVKPNPVVRFVTKWLLGWKWKDV